MRDEILNKGLIKYFDEQINDYIKDYLKEHIDKYAYLKCTNDFYQSLEKKYNIKFNSELMDEDLKEKITSEIFEILKK